MVGGWLLTPFVSVGRVLQGPQECFMCQVNIINIIKKMGNVKRYSREVLLEFCLTKVLITSECYFFLAYICTVFFQGCTYQIVAVAQTTTEVYSVT